MYSPVSLLEGALSVLHEPDPWAKAAQSERIVAAWQAGALPILPTPDRHLPVPNRPARSDESVKVVPSGRMPKLGRGGTLVSRQAIIHSLAHIESWAVDLSWDIIARFGADAQYRLPRAFFDDFVAVAADEGRHFRLLAAHLEAIGSHYGALPAHDGLWESAAATAHSLPARLAVEHCLHEARGLDVLPTTVARLRAGGDAAAAALLEETVYPEEVTHVAAGVRWLRHLHAVATGTAGATVALGVAADGVAASAAGERSVAALAGEEVAASSRGQAAADRVAPGTTAGSAASTSERRTRGVATDAAAPDGVTDPCGCRHGLSSDAAAPLATQNAALQDTQHHVRASSPCAAVRDHAAEQNGACEHVCGCNGTDPSWSRQARACGSVEEWFHTLVRDNFHGNLKPPFNDEARRKAGFTEAWYSPLVQAAPARRE